MSPSPAWVACKMVAYTAVFLAFILGAVPYGFDALGRMVYPPSIHDWLGPESPQRVVGLTVFAVGLVGYLVCSLWLVIVGKGPFVEFDPPKAFVATGPYRWMRNPVAAMLIVTVLGEAVFFGSAGIMTLCLLGLPLAQLQVTRIEEPRLRARFGDAYVEYCHLVPRWVPRRPRPEKRETCAVRESGGDGSHHPKGTPRIQEGLPDPTPEPPDPRTLQPSDP